MCVVGFSGPPETREALLFTILPGRLIFEPAIFETIIKSGCPLNCDLELVLVEVGVGVADKPYRSSRIKGFRGVGVGGGCSGCGCLSIRLSPSTFSQSKSRFKKQFWFDGRSQGPVDHIAARSSSVRRRGLGRACLDGEFLLGLTIGTVVVVEVKAPWASGGRDIGRVKRAGWGLGGL